MKKSDSLVLMTLIILLLGFGTFIYSKVTQPGLYNTFAQCLTEKGATFYGAFWCPHCQDQKSLFGKSISEVNYVECSTPDGSSQTQECKDKDIKGYPTWIFQDNTVVDKVMSLQDLADKTGCELKKDEA